MAAAAAGSMTEGIGAAGMQAGGNVVSSAIGAISSDVNSRRALKNAGYDRDLKRDIMSDTFGYQKRTYQYANKLQIGVGDQQRISMKFQGVQNRMNMNTGQQLDVKSFKAKSATDLANKKNYGNWLEGKGISLAGGGTIVSNYTGGGAGGFTNPSKGYIDNVSTSPLQSLTAIRMGTNDPFRTKGIKS